MVNHPSFSDSTKLDINLPNFFSETEMFLCAKTRGFAAPSTFAGGWEAHCWLMLGGDTGMDEDEAHQCCGDYADIRQ